MPSVATARAVGGLRQSLRHEAALGADRHDHRVLHLLRLGETEHLGAEVERPVRPADAAARHPAEAEMHAFDPRAVDEDFAERPRRRQLLDPFRVELEDDLGARLAVRPRLEEVGTDGRVDDVEEAADDAVLVEALDAFERRLDLGDLPLRLVLVHRVGVETAPEQLYERSRQPGMAAERRPHVVLGEGRPGLAEIAGDGADQRHVAPRQAGIHGQRIVAVALGLAVPDRHEAGERERRDRVEVEGLAVGALEIHVVDEDRRTAFRLHLIGLLVDDAKPQCPRASGPASKARSARRGG